MQKSYIQVNLIYYLNLIQSIFHSQLHYCLNHNNTHVKGTRLTALL